MPSQFQIVDVFHLEPLSGNPLAVVFDREDLSTEKMQRVAQWFNLSETAFIVPPRSSEADYGVRIFTLERELPFAGHPTLGSCHAWLSAGGKPRNPHQVIQECGAGLVRIKSGGARLAFAAPPLLRSGPLDEAKTMEIAEILRIERNQILDAQWVDNGPGWMAVLLGSAQEVLAVAPQRYYPKRVDIGIVGPAAEGADTAFEIRAIFSDHHLNLIEDPVTGSLNASIAQWLLSSGRAAAPYVAAQGAKVGRSGRVFIERESNGQIWVGGRTTSVATGHHTL